MPASVSYPVCLRLSAAQELIAAHGRQLGVVSIPGPGIISRLIIPIPWSQSKPVDREVMDRRSRAAGRE